MVFASGCAGQYRLPTRVEIPANPARTQGGELRVLSSTNASYSALTSGSIVFPSLTGIYDNGGGVQVWRSGLIGARATMTPGGVAGSGRLTLCNTDISACTGFYADPAMATAAVYQLPAADGSSGDCLSTNGSLVLSWVSCSGGGSSPPFVDSTYLLKGSVDATKRIRIEVDGLTTATDRIWTAQDKDLTVAGIDVAQTWTATQTMRDINPSVTDTYKLGDTARWYQIAANRLDGICTGCTTSSNYARTRKLEVYDQSGGTAFWHQLATVPLAGTSSSYALLDNLGTQVATFQTSDLSGINRLLYWKGSIIPGTPSAAEDNTWDLGASGNKYKKLWVYDIDSANLVTGTISNGGSSIGVTGTLLWSTGSNVQPSQLNLWGGGVSRLLASNGGAGGSGFLRVMNTAGDRYWGFKAATATTGTSTDWVLPTADGTSGQCMSTDGATNLSWRTCGIGTVISVSTTGPISGGTITSTGTISCPTCVTTDTTQTITGAKTFSSSATFSAGVSMAASSITWTTGSNVQSSQLNLWGGGVSRILLSNGGTLGSGFLRFFNTAGDRFWGLKASTLTTGTSTEWILPTADGSADQCIKTDGSANLGWRTCGGVTSIATSGPISGGTITGSGTISCPTCVTTAGGQTVGGSLTTTGLLSTSGANIQVDAANTYAVSGGYFGASYTGGINVGSSTLYFKSGILYACTGTC